MSVAEYEKSSRENVSRENKVGDAKEESKLESKEEEKEEEKGEPNNSVEFKEESLEAGK